MKTVDKLYKQIMEYWEACAYCNSEKDFAINDLLEKYALSCGIHEDKLEYRIDLTIRSMTNSQKRKLYDLMIKSGIRERKVN